MTARAADSHQGIQTAEVVGMWDSLHWKTAIDSAEAETQLNEMRADILRLFVQLSIVGWIAWHLTSASIWTSDDQLFRTYAVSAAAGLVLVGAYVLLEPNRRAATALFVCGST